MTVIERHGSLKAVIEAEERERQRRLNEKDRDAEKMREKLAHDVTNTIADDLKARSLSAAQ